MRWILLLFTLLAPLLGRVEASPAGALPIVLASRVDLRLVDGGVRARVWVETHASTTPSQAFPVVSGAGSLLQWTPAPSGAFRMVDPTEAAPGSPAFVQQVAGRAQLTLEMWQPLGEGVEELVMRLPPTPEGSWSLVGMEPETLVDFGGPEPVVVPENGAMMGKTPDDGLLWLSWGGRERARTAGFLEACRVDLFIREDGVHYKARLQGFQPSGQLSIEWSPAFIPVEEESHAGVAPRTYREGGVEVHGLRSDWFDETFEGTVHFDDKDEAAVHLPQVAGLARARLGEVTVHPEVPRALRLLAGESPGGKKAWEVMALPEGRRRYRLSSRTQAVPLRFLLSGVVQPTPAGVRLVRMSAHSEPVEGEAEASVLVRTRLEFKVEGAGKDFSLHFPEQIRVALARWNSSRVANMPKDIPAGTTADFPVEGAGKFVLEFFHGDPKALPVYGTLGLRLPRPLALQRPEAPPGERHAALVPGHFEWNGRLPSSVEVLAPAEVGGFPGERSPYPLRWTQNFFDGVLVVLREAGVVVAFGLALLLGLYASLFMRPPNKQAVYMLAFAIAVFGLIYNLFQAAGQAPAGAPGPAGGSSVLPDMVERMRSSARRFTDLMAPGEEPGAEPGGHVHATGGEGAGPGFGDLLGRRMWGEGARSGSAASRARVVVDAEGRPLTPAGVFGLDLPPPIPDDWTLTRLPTRATAPSSDLELVVGQAVVLQAVGLLLGVIVLVGAVLSRQSGGATPILVMTAGALLLIPLDLAFPRSAAPGASLVLASLLGLVLHRAVADGMAVWERVRQELEQRRLKALSRTGGSGGGMGNGRDTAGGAFSGSSLQKNEASYEDVFPDDDGITFIVGEG